MNNYIKIKGSCDMGKLMHNVDLTNKQFTKVIQESLTTKRMKEL